MTLFINKEDKRLYIIVNHGIYGYRAEMYCFTNRIHFIDYEDIGTKYLPVSNI